jgi:hypothetical protein
MEGQTLEIRDSRSTGNRENFRLNPRCMAHVPVGECKRTSETFWNNSADIISKRGACQSLSFDRSSGARRVTSDPLIPASLGACHSSEPNTRETRYQGLSGGNWRDDWRGRLLGSTVPSPPGQMYVPHGQGLGRMEDELASSMISQAAQSPPRASSNKGGCDTSPSVCRRFVENPAKQRHSRTRTGLGPAPRPRPAPPSGVPAQGAKEAPALKGGEPCLRPSPGRLGSSATR